MTYAGFGFVALKSGLLVPLISLDFCLAGLNSILNLPRVSAPLFPGTEGACFLDLETPAPRGAEVALLLSRAGSNLEGMDVN